MSTVHEVAKQYGVSDAFMVQALGQIGYKDTTSETALTAQVISRFEAEFGEKIRKARPRAQSDTTPIASRAIPEPRPHIMRIAHERITSGRNPAGLPELRLLEDPGAVHAIDAVGTRDGDPWSGAVVPGAVHFFGGTSTSGPTAACGRVHMRAVLGDEFVPEEDPASAGQCPRCATLVVAGKGFRNRPTGDSSYPFCTDYLRVRIDGNVEVQECTLRNFHRGPHRTRDGATWDVGFEDFVPAPLDSNRRIAKASEDETPPEG